MANDQNIPVDREFWRNVHQARVERSTLAADDQNCIICLEQYDDQANGKHLPLRLACGHIVGESCIRTWFMEHESCPACRRTVLVPASQEYQVEYPESMNVTVDNVRGEALQTVWADPPVSTRDDRLNIDSLRRDYKIAYDGFDYRGRNKERFLKFQGTRVAIWHLGILKPDVGLYTAYHTCRAIHPYDKERRVKHLDARFRGRRTLHKSSAKRLAKRALFEIAFGHRFNNFNDNDQMIPTIAAHPWGWRLCDYTRALLTRLDGQRITAFELREKLRKLARDTIMPEVDRYNANGMALPGGVKEFMEDYFEIIARQHARVPMEDIEGHRSDSE